jgi:protein TonB
VVDDPASMASSSVEKDALDESTSVSDSDKSIPLTTAQQLRLDNAFPQLLKQIHDVKPQYPTDCLEAGIQGTVILEIVIEKDGTVRDDVRVLRGLDCEGMDEAAIKAARQWIFEPIVFEGIAVTKICTMTIKFSLD